MHGCHSFKDLTHNTILADHLVTNGDTFTLLLAKVVLVLASEHVTLTLLGQRDLAFGPGRLLYVQAKCVDTLSVVIGLARNGHLIEHLLVDTFGFLGLTCCDTFKIDILLHLNDFTTYQHSLLLAIAEVWHEPGFLAPLLQSSLDQLLKLVRRPLLLLVLGSGRVLLFEHDLEEEAEELARFLLVWEEEHVEAQVVEVSKVL